jgi:hypothetical protein
MHCCRFTCKRDMDGVIQINSGLILPPTACPRINDGGFAIATTIT